MLFDASTSAHNVVSRSPVSAAPHTQAMPEPTLGTRADGMPRGRRLNWPLTAFLSDAYENISPESIYISNRLKQPRKWLGIPPRNAGVSHPLYPRTADWPLDPYLTMVTGIGAKCTTCSAIEPTSRCFRPVAPLLPMTIIPASCFFAISRIRVTGKPMTSAL